MRIKQCLLLGWGVALALLALGLISPALPAQQSERGFEPPERTFLIDYSSTKPVLSAKFYPDDSISVLPTTALTILPDGEVVLIFGKEKINHGTYTAKLTPAELRVVIARFINLGLLDSKGSAEPTNYTTGHSSTLSLEFNLAEYRYVGASKAGFGHQLQLRLSPKTPEPIAETSTDSLARSAADLVWETIDEIFRPNR